MNVFTGRGGVKEYIKAFCKTLGVEYNWRNFRHIYTKLRKEGYITRHKLCNTTDADAE